MTDYTVMTHPLIQHKISKLRDKNTGTAEFRALVEEIAMLMGYEALKDLPTEDVCIETPIEECMTPVIAGRNLAIVPILRAGLGMVSGLQALVPTAKIGHIGLYTAVSISSSCRSSLHRRELRDFSRLILTSSYTLVMLTAS